MIEFLIAAIICVVLDLLLLVRVLNGPTAVDRLCAIDCMSVVTALGLSAYTPFWALSVRCSYPVIWREDYEYDFASDY